MKRVLQFPVLQFLGFPVTQFHVPSLEVRSSVGDRAEDECEAGGGGAQRRPPHRAGPGGESSNEFHSFQSLNSSFYSFQFDVFSFVVFRFTVLYFYSF